ncbi:hypothetical protein LJR153_007297 [Paenibacillus sp. LjRoot153]|uniref:hypothetical protein n=1 Tax=Paenibacillus sp. LjRoot153 TaxID=3342270 RepID=UPI003ECED0D3
MKWSFETVLYLMIMTFMSVALILDHGDAKNATYIEIAATEAALKVPPQGYITPQIKQEIKDFLAGTRGMDPVLVQIDGTNDIALRKVRGQGNDTITLTIKYPRKYYIFFDGMKNSLYTAKRTIKTEYTGR